jgi:hypothetical protein
MRDKRAKENARSAQAESPQGKFAKSTDHVAQYVIVPIADVPPAAADDVLSEFPPAAELCKSKPTIPPVPRRSAHWSSVAGGIAPPDSKDVESNEAELGARILGKEKEPLLMPPPPPA